MRGGFTVVPAAVVVAACASHGGAPPPAQSTLVVGLEGEQITSLLTSVHVTTTVDGAPATDDTIDLKASPQALPKEITLTAPAGKPHAAVAVHVDATNGLTGTSVETLTRDAATAFVDGETKLLRIQLEAHCLSTPLFPISCPAGQTCLDGRCQDDTVLASDLEAYSPTWATDAPDPCKPAGHGDPTVIVGTGQSDFLPLTDGQTLQAERGPQGGHHLWIAVRMKNLKQSGSTTTITGVQPGTNVSIPPTSFVFTFTQDEGGYCKLWGLRYQLDNGGIDYHQFLGKPLDITVKVLDTAGSEATSVAHVNVAPTVLGESP